MSFEPAGAGARCLVGLLVSLDGNAGWLPVAAWTTSGASYRQLREGLRLPAFRGSVAWNDGRWSLEPDDGPGFAVEPGREATGTAPTGADLPWLSPRATLDPDWRMGPLAASPAELWSLRSATPARTGDQRAVECVTRGDPGGWLRRLGATGPVAASTLPGGPDPTETFERDVDRSGFEPFAFRNYRGGFPGLPPDPQFASTESLGAYRGLRAERLEGLLVVDLRCVAGGPGFERLIPPPCRIREDRSLRVLAVRGLENPDRDEAWLMAGVTLEGVQSWYALAHVRASPHGSEFGREVLGYPTLSGSINVQIGANRVTAAVARDGQDLFRGFGSYGGFSTGTSLAELSVATLRVGAQKRDGARPGELVVQPWRYHGLRRRVAPGTLNASFPAPRREGGGIWNEIGPVHPYRATVLDGAGIQRLPGRVAATVPHPDPFYRDRCGGHLPWEAVGPPQPSD